MYIIPTTALLKTIFSLDIGKLFKYSIVLSFSSLTNIFDPSIPAYTPTINNIITNPSDFSHPNIVESDAISILNADNISSGNICANSSIDLILSLEAIEGYIAKTTPNNTNIIIVQIIKFLKLHFNSLLNIASS